MNVERTSEKSLHHIYEVQHGPEIDGYRITDTRSDSRVATCYSSHNAFLVCAALNEYTDARRGR
jgi:hypothetical protein